MVNVGGNLVLPNLPPGETLTGINLKKVTGQSKYIFILPAEEIAASKIPREYYVSYSLDTSDDKPLNWS